MMEFTNNDGISKSTKITPFFFNTGFNPRMSFSPTSKEYSSIREKLYAAKAGDITNKIKEVLRIGKQNIAKAQEVMCVQANKKRRVIDIHEGDFVILDSKELETKRPYKKLDDVRHGLYKVKKALGTSY